MEQSNMFTHTPIWEAINKMYCGKLYRANVPGFSISKVTREWRGEGTKRPKRHIKQLQCMHLIHPAYGPYLDIDAFKYKKKTCRETMRKIWTMTEQLMALRNSCPFFLCVIIYRVFLKYPHVSDTHKIQNNQNGIGKV